MTAPLFAGVQNPMSIPPIRFVAGGTITKNQVLKLDTTEGKVVAGGAVTDLIIGTALEGASSGDEVDVQVYGVALVVAGAAVSLGDQLSPTTAGQVITASGATCKNCAVALQPASAQNAVFSALLGVPNLNGIVQT